MPTYVYRREDGTTFEIEQRITEDALDTCPTTGQPVRRIISGSAGLIFKGQGFYLTDYARSKTSPGNTAEAPAETKTNGNGSTSAKPAEKAATPAAAPSKDAS